MTIDSAGVSAAAQSLLVRGTALLDTVDGIADEDLQAAAKTMEGADLAGFEQSVRATYEQMVRISVTPAWARFFDFEAGRLPATSRSSSLLAPEHDSPALTIDQRSGLYNSAIVASATGGPSLTRPRIAATHASGVAADVSTSRS